MLLASNRFYTLAVVLFIYWLATFISLKGLDWVGKVAKIGGLVGTIIPAGLLVVDGVASVPAFSVAIGVGIQRFLAHELGHIFVRFFLVPSQVKEFVTQTH